MSAEALIFRRIAETPVPIWFLDGEFNHRCPIGPLQIESTFLGDELCWFRAVDIGRLGRVLTRGVDVERTNGPIWVGDFDKAWEYGGFPKVISALATDALKDSFRSIPRTAPQDDVDALKKIYPYMEEVEDELWFSKVENPNPGYEVPYGRWIPGDPFEALKAIFLFGTLADLNAYLQAETQVHRPSNTTS